MPKFCHDSDKVTFPVQISFKSLFPVEFENIYRFSYMIIIFKNIITKMISQRKCCLLLSYFYTNKVDIGIQVSWQNLQ